MKQIIIFNNRNVTLPEPWAPQYAGLKFTSTGNSTVALQKNRVQAPTVDLKYSLDGGLTWTQWNFSAISLTDGQTVCLKGLNTRFAIDNASFNYFVMTGSIAASGNIMSIIDDGACTTTTIPNNDYCFGSLFINCTSLTSAPELPATTLATVCYYQMFQGCTSLTTVPALPATTLAISCYSNMFNGCTALTTAPTLPATTLADSCYHSMFSGCTALTTAPALPATTLATSCYSTMFYNCTSLTTAPELPATTLEAWWCYRYMFQGCINLNYIKCLATYRSSSNCTTDWVDGVSETGTFVKAASASWSRNTSGIPSGWTVQDAA